MTRITWVTVDSFRYLCTVQVILGLAVDSHRRVVGLSCLCLWLLVLVLTILRLPSDIILLDKRGLLLHIGSLHSLVHDSLQEFIVAVWVDLNLFLFEGLLSLVNLNSAGILLISVNERVLRSLVKPILCCGHFAFVIFNFKCFWFVQPHITVITLSLGDRRGRPSNLLRSRWVVVHHIYWHLRLHLVKLLLLVRHLRVTGLKSSHILLFLLSVFYLLEVLKYLGLVLRQVELVGSLHLVMIVLRLRPPFVLIHVLFPTL